ncbi:MAG: malto-oligosyltrehalose synthase [Acidimicrobiales bacterium]
MRPLIATYRLQLTPDEGFAAAAASVADLAALGVSHLYLSPVAEAVPGSTHGYDVADPGRLRAELGGDAGFAVLVAAAHAQGLGLVVDVVPNHLAAHPANPWWWDVLRLGPRSRWAEAFDIDWDPPKSALRGKVLLPILGDHYGRELEAGTLRVERGPTGAAAGEGRLLVLRYHEHELPIRPASVGALLARVADAVGDDELGLAARVLRRSEADDLEPDERDADLRVAERRAHERLVARPDTVAALDAELAALNADADALDAVLADQHHRPARWRVAWAELDYRRFFDINALAATRIERPVVFDAVCELPLRLVAEGALDGLRVDHVDGLRDPDAFFDRLRAAMGAPTDDEPDACAPWLVVEKILRPDEVLPERWPVDGATGYEVADHCTGWLVDPDGAARLVEAWQRATGATATFAEVALVARRQILADSLAADVERLTDLLVAVCESRRRHRDHARPALRDALVEVAAHAPAYRSYVRFEGGDPRRPVVHAADEAFVRSAVAGACAARPELDPELAELLVDVLCGRAVGPAEAELVARFQQLTGPVIAKGDEDTALYRWTPVLARCEVGVEPDRLSVAAAELHGANVAAQASHPRRMTTLSTHDTKRAADVRARLAVVTADPQRFAEGYERWWAAAEPHRTAEGACAGDDGCPGEGGVDRGTGWYILQTLVGAHPLPAGRAWSAVEKAIREAKSATSWTDPDEVYEAAVRRLIDGAVADPACAAVVAELAEPVVDPGRAASLAQLLLLLVAPGIPDTYQGGEAWDLSLVDPDNRRPVDPAGRRALLDALDAIPSPGGPFAWGDEGARATGLPKALVLREALRLRRRRPASFGAGPAGAYTPLAVSGADGARVLAIARGAPSDVVAVVARPDRHGWAVDATVAVPAGRWVDVLSGLVHDGGTDVAWSSLAPDFPVALLERGGDDASAVAQPGDSA